MSWFISAFLSAGLAAGHEPVPPTLAQDDVASLIVERAQAVADRDAAQKRIEELNEQLLELGIGVVNARVWRISQVIADPPFEGSEQIHEMLVDFGEPIARCHGRFRGKMTTHMSVVQGFDGGYPEPVVPNGIWKSTSTVFTDSMSDLLIEGAQANEIGRCISQIFRGRLFPAHPLGTWYGFTFAFELY